MSNNLKPFLSRLAAPAGIEVALLTGRERGKPREALLAQIGALLMAMRVRGETVPELTGAVRAMRARMTRLRHLRGNRCLRHRR